MVGEREVARLPAGQTLGARPRSGVLRYHIRGKVLADVGTRRDASGGRGKAFGHVTTRSKPECAYANYSMRAVILVVDFESPATPAALMILRSKWFGNCAGMNSVDPLSEAPSVAA